MACSGQFKLGRQGNQTTAVQYPETRYARSEAGNVANQVVGEGSADLVSVPSWITNVDIM
jgi:hypothetical protein